MLQEIPEEEDVLIEYTRNNQRAMANRKERIAAMVEALDEQWEQEYREAESAK